MNIKGILSGWGNLILDAFDLLPENIKKQAEEKTKICLDCPVRDAGICSKDKKDFAVKDFYYLDKGVYRKKGFKYKGCGCPLLPKVLSEHSQCPLGKF